MTPASTFQEWIERRKSLVPDGFRPFLEDERPDSVEALLATAEAKLDVATGAGARDRDAAFPLLVADAFVTYACLRTILDGGGSEELERIARRIGGRWSPEGAESGPHRGADG